VPKRDVRVWRAARKAGETRLWRLVGQSIAALVRLRPGGCDILAAKANREGRLEKSVAAARRYD
jgi:hypothetical protein